MKTTSPLSWGRHRLVAGPIKFRPGFPGLVRPRVGFVCLLPLAGLQLLMPSAARGGETGESVAVYASVSPSYHRPLRPDGSFKVETYAFGEGGATGRSRAGRHH